MGIQERKSRHKEILRQEILDAARELFASGGYEGVSMRRIAERIEYSPATIYQFFQDKDALMSHIVAETLQKFSTRLVECLNHPGHDPFRRLLNGMRLNIEFTIENPSHYYVAFMRESATRRADHTKPDLCDERMLPLKQLELAVEQAAEKGWIRPDNVGLASHTILCGIHGVASVLVCRSGQCPFEARDILIEGMLGTMMVGMDAHEETVDRVLLATTLETVSQV